MEWKPLALYVVAGAAFVGGVHFLFSDPPPPEEAPERVIAEEFGGPIDVVDPEGLRVGPGRLGTGYMGSGKPQVVMDLIPKADEREARNIVERDEDERAVERRAEQLKPILENLGGLPVYIQGVDDVRTRPAEPRGDGPPDRR